MGGSGRSLFIFFRNFDATHFKTLLIIPFTAKLLSFGFNAFLSFHIRHYLASE